MKTRVSIKYFVSYCRSFLMVHTILRVPISLLPTEVVETLTVTLTHIECKILLPMWINELLPI